MKKTKILAPALGILCLSTAASVTGTVAWFSSNATVTAKGMVISAVTATNLFINNTTLTGGVFDPLATSETMIGLGDAGKKVDDITDTHNTLLAASATRLVPVSAIDHFDSYIYVDDSTKIAMGGQIFSDAVPSGAMTSTSVASRNYGALVDYVNVGAVDLYLQDESPRAITVEVKVTPTDAEKAALMNAVRIGLRWTKMDGSSEVAEPTMKETVFNHGGRDTVKPLTGLTEIAAEGQVCETFTTGEEPAVAYTISETGGMAANHTVRCYIFFYFEGQDPACVNQNSLNSDGYALDFKFNAVTA